MRLLLRLSPRGEDGIALIAALGVLLVLTVTTVTAVSMATSSQQTVVGTDANQSALANAEAGIAQAESILNATGANASSPTLLGCSVSGTNSNNSAQPCTGLSVTVSQGSASVYGLFTQGTGSSSSWTLYSTGTMPAANGAAAVSKQVTATVSITGGGQANNISVWNYVYSTAPAASGCQVTLSGDDATVEVPMYVTGNLCLSGDNSEIIQDKSNGGQAVDLRVMGTATISGWNAQIGQGGWHPSPLTSGYVAGGCRDSNSGSFHTCTTADNYYVSSTDTPLTATPPSTDFPDWYVSASPGPKNPCVSALTPSPNLMTSDPTAFDNNTTMDGTNTAFDLTPENSSYNCVTSTGTLDWNNNTNLLTINGTIFFDGNVYLEDSWGGWDGTEAMYQGKGTIYVNGELSFNGNNWGWWGGAGGLRAACASGWHGSLQPCGMNSSGSSQWNPNNNMILFVANAQNGTAVDMSADHTDFQGDILCPQSSTVSMAGGNTTVEGGLICGNFNFQDNSRVYPLPTITNLPPGAPLPPNAPATVGAPFYTKGG